MTYRAAPWSRAVVVVSVAVTAGCPALSGYLFAQKGVPLALALLPVMLVVGVFPFRIREYEWTGDALRVRRIFWTTRIPAGRVTEARYDPDALRGSVRLFGIGGLFVIDGWFWNRRLGRYRACLTDPERAVVLRFADRIVVISPEDPDAFLAAIRSYAPVSERSAVPM